MGQEYYRDQTKYLGHLAPIDVSKRPRYMNFLVPFYIILIKMIISQQLVVLAKRLYAPIFH